jgi:hypothetical protein
MATPVEKKSGIGGIARIAVDDKFVHVTFPEENKNYRLFREDCPDYVVKHGAGEMYVRLSSDTLKMYSARPLRGTLPVKLEKFPHEENKPPMMYTQVGHSKDGRSFNSLKFNVLLKVIAGEWMDFIIPFSVNYAFAASTGDPTIAAITGAGMKKCEDFLVKFGWDFMGDTIPMSDNVLAYVEKILLSRNKVVLVELGDKGYINALTYPPDGIDFTKQVVAPSTYTTLTALGIDPNNITAEQRTTLKAMFPDIKLD